MDGPSRLLPQLVLLSEADLLDLVTSSTSIDPRRGVLCEICRVEAQNGYKDTNYVALGASPSLCIEPSCTSVL